VLPGRPLEWTEDGDGPDLGLAGTPPDAPEGRAGGLDADRQWLARVDLFAGVLLIMVGVLQVIEGLVALFDDG
jgi:hypothetical protein